MSLATLHTLQKDKELCRHMLHLIDEDRLKGWHTPSFKNYLCSDDRTRNIIDSLGVDYLDTESIQSILNILETIE